MTNVVIIESKKSDLVKLMSNDLSSIKNKTPSTKYIPWCGCIISELGVILVSKLLISYFLKIASK